MKTLVYMTHTPGYSYPAGTEVEVVTAADDGCPGRIRVIEDGAEMTYWPNEIEREPAKD